MSLPMIRGITLVSSQKTALDDLHNVLIQAKAIHDSIRSNGKHRLDIAPTCDHESLTHDDGYHQLNNSDHHSLVSQLIKSTMQVIRSLQGNMNPHDVVNKMLIRQSDLSTSTTSTWTSILLTISRREKDKDIINISFERDGATGYFRPSFTLVTWHGEQNNMHNLLQTNYHHKNFDIMFGISSQSEHHIYGFPVYLVVATPYQPIKIDLASGVFGDVDHTWKIVRIKESERDVREQGVESLLPKWQEKHMIYYWKPDSWTMFFALEVKDSILGKGKSILRTVSGDMK